MTFSALISAAHTRLAAGLATGVLLYGLTACSAPSVTPTTSATPAMADSAKHSATPSHTASHMVTASAPSASVLHRVWHLKTVQNKPASALGLQAAELALQADQSMYGTTGCNRFFGTYTASITPDATPAALVAALRFGHGMGMTRMACPDVQEHSLMQLLEATRQARVTGQQLVLLDAQGVALTIWHAADSPPLPVAKSIRY